MNLAIHYIVVNLENEAVNFMLNFTGKLTSSLQEKFASFGEIFSEFSLYVVVTSFRNYCF